MTEEKLQRANGLQESIKKMERTLEQLCSLDEKTPADVMARLLFQSDIAYNKAFRHLTYAYAVKCRELLAQDLEQTKKEFEEL